MRIPNAHDGDVVVESLTVDDACASTPSSGKRLRELLERRHGGEERATCVRFDPSITPDMPREAFASRVPRLRYRATVRYVARGGEGGEARGVVAWLAGAIGDASLEETLLAGLGDADLSCAVAPTQWHAAAAHGDGGDGDMRAALAGRTADGKDVSAPDLRFDFGPRTIAFNTPDALVFRDGGAAREQRVDVALGSALVTSTLMGPFVPEDDEVRRSGPGWYETKLAFRAVVAIGRGPLRDVVRQAIGGVEWNAHARNEFQYVESLWDFKD